MKAIITIKTKKSNKTGNSYEVLSITLDNGVEIECVDFAAVKELKNVETLIKALGLN